MAKVKKSNRILTVNDNAVETYLQRGYDQIDDKGKVIKRATGGRMVPLSEHNAVLDQLEELKDAAGSDELKKENSVLKGKVTKLENKVKELEEALEKATGQAGQEASGEKKE